MPHWMPPRLLQLEIERKLDPGGFPLSGSATWSEWYPAAELATEICCAGGCTENCNYMGRTAQFSLRVTELSGLRSTSHKGHSAASWTNTRIVHLTRVWGWLAFQYRNFVRCVLGCMKPNFHVKDYLPEISRSTRLSRFCTGSVPVFFPHCFRISSFALLQTQLSSYFVQAQWIIFRILWKFAEIALKSVCESRRT